jgi:hypothetical protein
VIRIFQGEVKVENQFAVKPQYYLYNKQMDKMYDIHRILSDFKDKVIIIKLTDELGDKERVPA